MTVRLAIIGSGFGAQVHLPGFAATEGADVVAIADAGSGRAQQVAHQAGVPMAYSSWQPIINDDRIDAVSVAATPDVQADIVCAALSNGKHTLCEKPFGRTITDATNMCDAACSTRLINAIDFQFRMEPGIAELKRQIDLGTIGPLRRIDVTWLTGGRADPDRPWSWQHDRESGGGVIDALSSHVVDYLEWVANPISRVFAQSQILIRSRRDGEGNQRRVTAEDSVDLMCLLSDGVVATAAISNCHRADLGHRIEVYGKDGRLVFIHQPPFAPSNASLVADTKAGRREIDLSTPVGASADSRSARFQELASRFVDAISGKVGGELPSFQDGLRVRRVLDAVRQSIHEERAIECQH